MSCDDENKVRGRFWFELIKFDSTCLSLAV